MKCSTCNGEMMLNIYAEKNPDGTFGKAGDPELVCPENDAAHIAAANTCKAEKTALHAAAKAYRDSLPGEEKIKIACLRERE